MERGLGTITIKNTATSITNGWTHPWTWAATRRSPQSWNANYAQRGANAALTNMSYNPMVAAGATLTPGIVPALQDVAAGRRLCYSWCQVGSFPTKTARCSYSDGQH